MLHVIKPGDIDSILRDAPSLIEQAGRIPADTANWTRETFAAVGDLRKMLKARIKAAEELRLSWTRPINQGIKNINEYFKGRTAALEQADDFAGQLQNKWAAEQERINRAKIEQERREAEERALKDAQAAEEAARAAREAEAKAAAAGNAEAAQQAAEDARAAELRRDAVIDQAAALPQADPEVRRARGLYGSTSSTTVTWRIRLVNLRALPDEAVALIMASESARNEIRKALRPLLETRLSELRDSGKCAELPGVEFYEDKHVTVR
jgi:predicted phage tail protein